MKKLVLFMLFPLFCQAQQVLTVQQRIEKDYEQTTYCEVTVVVKNPGMTKWLGYFDFGQQRKTEFIQLYDKSGDQVIFRSKMDVVNYMVTYEWELVESKYDFTKSFYYYIMKKE